jgi:hypothetical protein
MKQPAQRPPRTDAHRERDALLARFAALGLQPVVSTNGSNPEADIQIVKGAQPGDVPQCWLTVKGTNRLYHAGWRE